MARISLALLISLVFSASTQAMRGAMLDGGLISSLVGGRALEQGDGWLPASLQSMAPAWAHSWFRRSSFGYATASTVGCAPDPGATGDFIISVPAYQVCTPSPSCITDDRFTRPVRLSCSTSILTATAVPAGMVALYDSPAAGCSTGDATLLAVTSGYCVTVGTSSDAIPAPVGTPGPGNTVRSSIRLNYVEGLTGDIVVNPATTYAFFPREFCQGNAGGLLLLTQEVCYASNGRSLKASAAASGVRSTSCFLGASGANRLAGGCTSELPSGSSCTVTCAANYVVSGPPARCLNGNLLVPVPTCVAAPCTGVAPEPNVILGPECAAGTLAVGSSCAATCEAGYQLALTSPTMLTCQSGQSGPSLSTHPTCSQTPCSVAVLANGSFEGVPSGQLAVGLSCTARCNVGFSLASGAPTVTCMFGPFLAPTPFCAASACTVPVLPNGVLSGSCVAGTLGIGSQCSVSCLPSYQLRDAASSTLSCLPASNPSSMPTLSLVPVCDAVCSSGCMHGTCSSPQICTCLPGWKGTSCDQSICAVHCQNDGVCDSSSSTCSCSPFWSGDDCSIPVSCPLRDIANIVPGTACVNPLPSGATCTISCQANYAVTAGFPVMCEAGVLSGPQQTCAPICEACQPNAICSQPGICGECAPGWAVPPSCSTPAMYVISQGTTCAAHALGMCTDFGVPGACPPAWRETRLGQQCANPSQADDANFRLASDWAVRAWSHTFTGWASLPCGPLNFGLSVRECVPECQPPCENGGTCMAPNQCSCAPAFTGPSCSAILGCTLQAPTNGGFDASCARDVLPVGASCAVTCAAGFRLASSSPVNVYCSFGPSLSITPTCEPESCQLPALTHATFIGTTCVAGNVLAVGETCPVVCEAGYEFALSSPESINCYFGPSPSSSPTCEPVCSPSCGGNAQCVAPNTCVCFDGWSGPTCHTLGSTVSVASLVRRDPENHAILTQQVGWWSRVQLPSGSDLWACPSQSDSAVEYLLPTFSDTVRDRYFVVSTSVLSTSADPAAGHLGGIVLLDPIGLNASFFGWSGSQVVVQRSVSGREGIAPVCRSSVWGAGRFQSNLALDLRLTVLDVMTRFEARLSDPSLPWQLVLEQNNTFLPPAFEVGVFVKSAASSSADFQFANLSVIPVACSACTNGVCIDYEVCDCFADWAGDDCATPQCLGANLCLNGGSCTAPNTCQCTSGWEGPTCANRISCAVPPPTHGTLGNCQAVIFSGSSCSVQCNAGYTLAGGASTTCLAGILTAQECSPNACAVTPPPHATIGSCGSLITDGTCQLACAAGYTLADMPTATTCNAGIIALQSCVATACPIAVPLHGTIGSCAALVTDGSCQLGCMAGYTLNALPAATSCPAGNPSPQSCTANACAVTPPLHATIGSCASLITDGTCQLGCAAGYTLAGMPTATTCPAGIASLQSCLANACPIAVPLHGTIGSCAALVTDGSCQLDCMAGYMLNASPAATSCPAGNPSPQSCTAKTCPVTLPLHGTIGSCSSLLTDGTCQLGCTSGYALAATPTATSCPAGTFSPQSCVAKTCPVTLPLHGTIGTCSSLMTDGTCQLACTSGYALAASPSATTCPAGAISPQSCVAATCTVAAPAQGGIGNCASLVTDGTCQFTCLAGYSPSPAATTCPAGVATPQTCVAIACAVPGLANGQYSCSSGSLAVGGTCTATCNAGYTLSSSTPLTCSLGPVLGAAPTCLPVCDLGCNGKGACTSPNQCTCTDPSQWFGIDCSTAVTVDALLAQPLMVTSYLSNAFARLAIFKAVNPTRAARKFGVAPRSMKTFPSSAYDTWNPSTPLPGWTVADLKAANSFLAFPTSSGTGKIIAVTTAFGNPDAEASLLRFTRYWGLPGCTKSNGCFQQVSVCGNGNLGCESPLSSGTSSGVQFNDNWLLANDLDLQSAYAMAPGAKIISVHAQSDKASDLMAAVLWAKAHAHYVVNSWGTPADNQDADGDALFQPPAGGSMLFSTLASGVQYPASSPLVVAVGGTTSVQNGWSLSGGGCSVEFTAPTAQLSQSSTLCGSMRATPDLTLFADWETGLCIFSAGNWACPISGPSQAAPMLAGAAACVNVVLDASTIYGADMYFQDITSGVLLPMVAFNTVTGRGAFFGLAPRTATG